MLASKSHDPKHVGSPVLGRLKKLYLTYRNASRKEGDGIVIGVHAHASIGADAVGIEEFKHRCSVSGIFFFSIATLCTVLRGTG
jgi:hypothetical protein